MKWYEVKEYSAGEKRLMLTYFLYKTFGKIAVNIIAFFVGLGTFLYAKSLRISSAKNLSALGQKPSLFNVLRNILSYAFAQADKIEVFSGKFIPDNIVFENNSDMKSFRENVHNKKGSVCIFSHLGNIDVIRALLEKDKTDITIFLSLKQAEIFRNFLNRISVENHVSAYSVEDIGINTAIEIKDKINNGEFIFIAGDRVSENAGMKKFEVDFLNKKIDLPKGTFKLAELIEAPVFFVIAVKIKNKYKFVVKKFENYEKCSKNMASDFSKFIAEWSSKYPFQFYHFYDFFKD